MKLSSLRLVLVLALALLAFGCNGKRVGIVNTDTVYKESALSEKGTEYLKGVTTEIQSEFEALQAKAEQAKDKNAAQLEMQQALMALQQRLNAEQQQVITALSDAYKQAMDTVRAKQKLDIIIPNEAALSYDAKIDVTKQVMDEMSAINVEFKPLSTEGSQDSSSVAQ